MNSTHQSSVKYIVEFKASTQYSYVIFIFIHCIEVIQLGLENHNLIFSDLS